MPTATNYITVSGSGEGKKITGKPKTTTATATATSTPNYSTMQQPQTTNYTPTQVSTPGNTVNYGDISNQINAAKNTQNQAQYQSPDWFSQAAQSNYQAMDPIRHQQTAGINQQYNQSARQLSEMLAAKGLGRSGTATSQLMDNEIARNSAIGANNANLLQQAINQTIPQAQLGLSERGFLYGQQQDAVNNLANLLAQQTGHQQWGAEFNANQNMYANQYNNNLAQQLFQNQLGLMDRQEGQRQFDVGQGNWQQQFLENQRQFDTGQGNWQQQFDTSNQQWNQQFNEQQRQFDASQALQQRQLDLQQQGLSADQAYQQAQLELQRGELTGTIGGQQTMGAQQLAAMLAQQAQDNKFQQQGLDLNLLGTLLGYGGTLAGTTPNAPVPDNWGPVLSQLLSGYLN